jgi:hypothetical protein
MRLGSGNSDEKLDYCSAATKGYELEERLSK